MTNLFLEVKRKFPGSELMIWFASIAAFVIGVSLMVEDTRTSRLGYEALEMAYTLNPRTSDWIYWVVSFAPQVAQILFAYIFLTDMKKNWWALVVMFLFFLLDFSSDVYHSTGQLPSLNPRSIVAMGGAMVFFTIGAELFVTLGIGLFQQTTPPAIREIRRFFRESSDATFGSGRARPSSGSHRPSQFPGMSNDE